MGGSGHTIGGSSAAARNVSSGNAQYGIDVWGTDNTVQGNYVGTDVTGTAAIANSDVGVYVTGANNNIGGVAAGAGNLIAFNVGPGLAVSGATGNAILGNAFHSNTAIGIDLDDDGVTTNDGGAPPDQDTGGNDLQNFPVISSAVTDTVATITIDGSLDSNTIDELPHRVLRQCGGRRQRLRRSRKLPRVHDCHDRRQR